MSDDTDIPDTCEYGDCMKTPSHYVSFTSPAEKVYYCHQHAVQVGQSYEKAQGVQEI